MNKEGIWTLNLGRYSGSIVYADPNSESFFLPVCRGEEVLYLDDKSGVQKYCNVAQEDLLSLPFISYANIIDDNNANIRVSSKEEHILTTLEVAILRNVMRLAKLAQLVPLPEDVTIGIRKIELTDAKDDKGTVYGNVVFCCAVRRRVF